MERIDFINELRKHINQSNEILVNDNGLIEYKIIGNNAKKLNQMKRKPLCLLTKKYRKLLLLKEMSIEIFLNDININELLNEINLYKEVFDNKKNEYSITFNANEIFDFIKDKEKKSKKEIVYRLECDKGKGVYTSDLMIFSWNNSQDSHSTPIPTKEKNIKYIFNENAEKYDVYKKKWFFGFKKEEDILKWFFSKDIQSKFIKNNVKIVVYEVYKDFTLEGNKQIIFIKDKSEKVKELHFKEYYNNRSIIIEKT